MGLSKNAATVVASKDRWWVWAFLAAAGGTTMLILTPRVYEQVVEQRQLRDYGASTTGTVVDHRVRTGKSKCDSSAIVQYLVEGKAFRVEATGCGALPQQSPLGASADVTYVRSSPHVAEARRAGALTSRHGWPYIFVPWLLVGVAAAYARYLWSKRSPLR